MFEELLALQRQGTWSLVPFNSALYVVRCQWVSKLNHNLDGSVAKFKARIVGKGYHQEYDIDYTETFSPIVNLTRYCQSCGISCGSL